MKIFNSIEEIEEALKEQSYITDRALATVIFLSHRLRKPLFLEGEPGVGKTEVAITMSSILNTRLIRLQCYEGLDVSTAVYEWNYPRQMIHLKILERLERTRSELEKEIYSEEFLIRRPLLEAIVENSVAPPILLIDEIDRADEEFEAFLLELLSDFQITIPEIGTIKAKERPNVIITSNRTRDIHDALKRRCLYHWIDYPSFEKEYMIIRARIPDIDETLAWQIANFMQALRKEDLLKRPGISETLDWARALIEMQKTSLDEDVVNETLGCLLKYQEDIRRFKEEIWEDEERRRHYLGI